MALGKKVDPRVVFGWPALIEKILAKQAGIDDRTLEVAKILVMQNSEESPVPGQMELRLVGDEDGDLSSPGCAPSTARSATRCACRAR